MKELDRSVEGRTIYAFTMTAPTIPEEQKKHALVTALHAGIERGATKADRLSPTETPRTRN